VSHQNGQAMALQRLKEHHVDLGGGLLDRNELVESKLHPPSARPGIVPRTALVDRLLEPHAAPVVCVVAPPGYGKTTLLAQWAKRKGTRVGWVSVDRRDNDPAVLLTYLAVALDRIEPIDHGLFHALAAPGAVVATVMARFAATVSAITQPVTLVLDHVELLHNPQCLGAVAELAAWLPSGSQLALASRARPPLPVALLRTQVRVVEVGVQELAMDQREARALLQGAGVQLGDAEVTTLVQQTEGWPVGLYLAALALQAGAPHDDGFAGDDRLVADYLWSEVLSRLPAPTVSFLTRTAVLERMCGPLCDAVLDARGSTRALESLEGANLLLVPLDRRRKWYRYHHLFAELLRAELQRREPELVPQLHVRAAAWCEANGLPETAIDHAQAAGDTDRVARLVATLTQPAYAAGRVDTARRWLAWFEDQGLIERYPQVAVQGAWVQALVGRPAEAERWADAAERGPFVETLPDGGTMASHLALLRALLCRDGVERMRTDAQAALAGLGPGNPWQATALLLEGISYVLDGEVDRADPILAHAAEVATHAGATPAASTALAERAIVAMQRGDWPKAKTLAERAHGIMRAGHLDDYAMSPFVHAVVARTALQQGEAPRAKAHLARAALLRPLLTYAMPHRAVQILLELARAYLALGDAAGARVVLREAWDVLQQRPDLGMLPAQADELRGQLATIRGGSRGASSLTTAELRLLPLLSTHLSFREIGERLYVSAHTVKTQALSVYRKLGVSSRSQAIQRAQQIGLATQVSAGPPPFIQAGGFGRQPRLAQRGQRPNPPSR
jgi:LuxR family transcriptional regulator, maltose regulon positive regulatory protein